MLMETRAILPFMVFQKRQQRHRPIQAVDKYLVKRLVTATRMAHAIVIIFMFITSHLQQIQRLILASTLPVFVKPQSMDTVIGICLRFVKWGLARRLLLAAVRQFHQRYRTCNLIWWIMVILGHFLAITGVLPKPQVLPLTPRGTSTSRRAAVVRTSPIRPTRLGFVVPGL
mgnify:CR=1 FL=1